MKYFKIYDIIYVKEKLEGILIVTGLYPNEIPREGKEQRGTCAPHYFVTQNYTLALLNNLVLASTTLLSNSVLEV